MGAAGLRRACVESLAIALGVAAVVLAVAVNHGAFELAKGPTYGLDRRVVVVEGVAPSASGIEAGLPSSSLTSADVTALGNPGYVPDGVAVAPTVGSRTLVSSLSRSINTDVIGSTDQFAKVVGYSVAAGRFITPADLQADAPVAVLGQTVVDSLFAGTNPIGQDVVIDGQNVQVVGTLQPKGYSGTYDQDDLVIIPITTAWKVVTPLATDPIDQVLIRAATPKAAARVAREATNTLLVQHNIVDPALADFTVLRQSQLVTSQVQTAQAVRRLLELGGALFLLTGAVYLALSRVSLRPFRRRDPASMDRVAGALLVGVIGAVVGVILGVVLAPSMQHLSTTMPPARVTIYGILAGAGLGILAGAAALLPAALFRYEGPDRPDDQEDSEALVASTSA
jgi:putative ABC transport system permease protein